MLSTISAEGNQIFTKGLSSKKIGKMFPGMPTYSLNIFVIPLEA